MKKILLCGVIIFLSIILIGCEENKDDVELKTKDEMLSHAKINFGEAEYISTQNEEYSVTYSLKDKEYRFEYECTSEVYQPCVNSQSCVMYYSEKTYCTFDEKYEEYVINKIDLDNMSDGYTSYKTLFALEYSSEAEAKRDLKNVMSKLKRIDNRGYYSNRTISIYDKNGTYLGYYDIETETYING